MQMVAESFEKVVGAMQQKQTNILAARAYEAQRIRRRVPRRRTSSPRRAVISC